MLSEYAAWNSGAAMKQHVKRTAEPAANRPAVRSTRANMTTIAAPPATRFTTVAHTPKLRPVTAIIAPTTAGNTGGKAKAQRAALASESPGRGQVVSVGGDAFVPLTVPVGDQPQIAGRVRMCRELVGERVIGRRKRHLVTGREGNDHEAVEPGHGEDGERQPDRERDPDAPKSPGLRRGDLRSSRRHGTPVDVVW